MKEERDVANEAALEAARLCRSRWLRQKSRKEAASKVPANARAFARRPVSPKPLQARLNTAGKRKYAISKLNTLLEKYQVADQIELLASVLVSRKKSDESIASLKQLLEHKACMRVLHEHSESVLSAARTHMMKDAFSVENGTAARILLKLSSRKLSWMRRLFSFNGAIPRQMLPGFNTLVPSLPSHTQMKLDAQNILDEVGGVHQQGDGQATEIQNLDRTLCQALALRARSGVLASKGTEDDKHTIIWAGDGFMGRKKSKVVQVGTVIGSVTTLNQSPNDVQFILAYKGAESYDVLNIRLGDTLRKQMQCVAREGVLRDEFSELPDGVGGCVQFDVGGDKPWLRVVLGQRSHRHSYFSHSCKCMLSEMNNLDHDQDTHYSTDCEELCRRAHISPEVALYGRPFKPFCCPCCVDDNGEPVRFESPKDIEKEEEYLDSLSVQEAEAWLDAFSRRHFGQHWNRAPLFCFRCMHT